MGPAAARGVAAALTSPGRPPVLILGEDEIRIAIRDAQVLVNYYMPPMPRMALMNYTVPAGFKDRGYPTSRLDGAAHGASPDNKLFSGMTESMRRARGVIIRSDR
jgi:hypothetical protein